ncbi:DUF3526 domain-containing protein [Acidovorax sp. A1169]|uniref:DUF3526 domain-containing protein n=1 Tax=Acidovorax sp. A1169 TaxID=3059524 RepID=UPI002737AC11|nr:DUF3526 domain-containing protein [Acidovorax sp. A1169]MDP4075996.1 DUF3526 domain-containing protein [Acidovorax sp. A1169]
MSRAVTRIAREEWRLMLRDRVAVLGLALLTVLTLVASLTAWESRRAADAERARYQAQANQDFEAQPDRHPHRMVHYGHFVFRPLNPLAAFDAGIDAYTGHTLFLEGHRQNSANFGDVRQSSLLLRFGQLTPAFVLQVLAPLLLVFLGHASLARERESGTLRILLAQGVRPGQIVRGKLLALAGAAALALLPAALALAWMGALSQPLRSAALLAGHALWLLLWALAVVGLSALFARRRDALLCLLALWTVTVILVPRLAADTAAYAHGLPTRLESDIAVARDLAAMGDSHNPDDPYFAGFRQKVLAQYGVARVEDLPVNYKGLLGMEGERMTSELFNRYAADSFDQQGRQSAWMDRAGLLSPLLALRRLSTATAGTDLASYRRFLEQGEHYRYTLIQSLNRLQAEKIRYADDRNPNRQNRVDRAHWHDTAHFQYLPAAPAAVLQSVLPAAATLLAWLAALLALLAFSARRLGRSTR